MTDYEHRYDADHRRPHRGPRLAGAHHAHGRGRLRPDATRARRRRVPRAGRTLRGRALSLDHRHAPLPLRRGRVQVLRRAAARAHRRRAPCALSAAGGAGQRVGAAAGRARRLPARARRLPRPLPPRRPAAHDAADPALPRGRPQHPAPGRLRRGRLPAAGRDHARPPGRGLRGRPVRPARAAPARAVTRPRHRPRARRLPDLPDPPPPGAGHPRLLPGDHAPRGGHGALRPAHDARRHLPRRRLAPCLELDLDAVEQASSPRSKRPSSSAITARSSSRPPLARLASTRRAMFG